MILKTWLLKFHREREKTLAIKDIHIEPYIINGSTDSCKKSMIDLLFDDKRRVVIATDNFS